MVCYCKTISTAPPSFPNMVTSGSKKNKMATAKIQIQGFKTAVLKSKDDVTTQSMGTTLLYTYILLHTNTHCRQHKETASAKENAAFRATSWFHFDLLY